MKHTLLQDNLIAAGVRNLKEFGYDAVTPDNIMTDFVFAPFFKEMLNSNKGVGAAIDEAINGLLTEMNDGRV